MVIKKNMKVWLKVRGKEIRGKVLNTFQGNYFKGNKRIGLRKFVTLKAGGQQFVLLIAEFNKRTRKRLI